MELQVEELQQVDPFMQKYRDAMARNRDAGLIQLNQQRENDQANIMSEANRAGMMYSDFPTRSKIQSAYQTGLDTLRNKGVELANFLKQSQETLNDYNYYTSLLNQK